MRSSALAWTVAGLAWLCAACGVDVEDICDGVAASECEGIPDYNDCVEDGRKVQRDAEREGCTTEFEAYLQCVDEDPCDWASSCYAERNAVRKCVGDFPEFH